MGLHVSMQPVVAIVAGISILPKPRLLNHIVSISLILFGMLGLMRGYSYSPG